MSFDEGECCSGQITLHRAQVKKKKPARASRLRTHFQMIMFSAGTYFALPIPTLHSTLAALSGVGILITTLLALNLGGNMLRTWTVYSTRDLPISSTMGCTRKGRLMFEVDRYLSNPSLTREFDLTETIASLIGIPHQFKLAVRRDERDGPVAIKLAELDTLVELAVVQLDGAVFEPARRRFRLGRLTTARP